eukprot:1188332-Prorocentrum_minimum.AAC.2
MQEGVNAWATLNEGYKVSLIYRLPVHLTKATDCYGALRRCWRDLRRYIWLVCTATTVTVGLAQHTGETAKQWGQHGCCANSGSTPARVKKGFSRRRSSDMC